MEKAVIIVSVVVGLLGLLSVVLGFAAEGTKLTPSDIVVVGDQCVYPGSAALGLGISSAFFLLVAQIVVSAASGCCGCCKSRALPSETKRIVGVICAVLSWSNATGLIEVGAYFGFVLRILAVVAIVLFLQGAAWNANVARDTAPDCYYLKGGVFATASVLTLVGVALGITSHVLLYAPSPAGAPKLGQPGIAMGQPHFAARPNA